MYRDLLNIFKKEPDVYETTGIAFWDDEHISKSMLEAHLLPEGEGASRNHKFIEASAAWIASLPAPGSCLLDLGCGPGLYAEQLSQKGCQVTGVDFSKRSIAYAKKSAADCGWSIQYEYKNYLEIAFDACFDVVILIYCDFGVLSPENRSKLLKKIFTALKPGGSFIVDTFSEAQFNDFQDETRISYEESGFWRAEPHLCIKRSKVYEDACFLEQYGIVTEEDLQVYHLWNHGFTQKELRGDLEMAGFSTVDFYGDAAGAPVDNNGATICAVARKGGE